MKCLLGLICFTVMTAAIADSAENAVERRLGDDLFIAGGSLSIDREVAGDLFAGAGHLTVVANVTGDAVLSGGEVKVDGDIGAGLFGVGGQVAVNGRVGRSARVAGGQVEFGSPSQVVGNLSVGGGRVTLKGRISGYLQVAGGDVLIDGVVGGDVEARAGHLSLGPHARIGGRLRYASRDDFKRDPAAQVLGEVERIDVAGGWPVPADLERGIGRGGGWIWTLGLLVVAAMLVWALPAFTGRVANTIRSRFPSSLLLGFVVVLCVPVAAVLLMLTLIGVPLGLAILASYLVTLLVGYVYAGVCVGESLAVRFSWNSHWQRVAFAMLGVLAIGLLARVPLLGGLVMALALLGGLGALVHQAWRSLPARP